MRRASTRIRAKTDIKAARIIETRSCEIVPSYCWRQNWATGHDSAYSLLGKFALLNGLGARDLARVIVSGTCGRKKLLVRSLDVDLRDASVFDLPKIARLCEQTTENVRAAFPLDTYTRSLLETSGDLRYCGDCLEKGFHSALFQLPFVPRCPIHHTRLQEQCRNCCGLIPYRLSASLFRKPFACPHCGWDFAPELRRLRAAGHQAITGDALERLVRASEIASAKSRFFGSIQETDRHFSFFFGRDRAIVSRPSIQRSKEEYYAFVDSLVHKIAADSSRDGAQGPIAEGGVILIEIVRGNHTVRKLVTRGRPRKSVMLSHQIREWECESTGPLSPKRSWASSVGGYGWDGKLRDLYLVYQAVRRHLWRRVLGNHRSCARSIAHRIWWDVEGDFIVRLCPAAEAFIRWRLFWEGYGVPADLFRNPRHAPFGLLTWLCDGAPIGAVGWTTEGEQWLAHRVFATQCLDTFYEWLTKCIANKDARPKRWLRADITGSGPTHWAVSGSDSPRAPLRLYLTPAPSGRAKDGVEAFSTAHLAWQHAQVQKVHH